MSHRPPDRHSVVLANGGAMLGSARRGVGVAVGVSTGEKVPRRVKESTAARSAAAAAAATGRADTHVSQSPSAHRKAARSSTGRPVFSVAQKSDAMCRTGSYRATAKSRAATGTVGGGGGGNSSRGIVSLEQRVQDKDTDARLKQAWQQQPLTPGGSGGAGTGSAQQQRQRCNSGVFLPWGNDEAAEGLVKDERDFRRHTDLEVYGEAEEDRDAAEEMPGTFDPDEFHGRGAALSKRYGLSSEATASLRLYSTPSAKTIKKRQESLLAAEAKECPSPQKDAQWTHLLKTLRGIADEPPTQQDPAPRPALVPDDASDDGGCSAATASPAQQAAPPPSQPPAGVAVATTPRGGGTPSASVSLARMLQTSAAAGGPPAVAAGGGSRGSRTPPTPPLPPVKHRDPVAAAAEPEDLSSSAAAASAAPASPAPTLQSLKDQHKRVTELLERYAQCQPPQLKQTSTRTLTHRHTLTTDASPHLLVECERILHTVEGLLLREAG